MAGGENSRTVVQADAVLFDLDGVLADSQVSIEKAWRKWASHVGLSWQTLAPFVPGRKAIDTIRAAVPWPVDDAWIAVAASEVNRLQTVDSEDNAAFPGVCEFYRSLPLESVAVVTSAPRALAIARLERRGLAVPNVVVAAEDVRNGKPHPEGWLTASSALGVRADACLAVEDAPVGVTSASAAGMRVVALATTHATAALEGANWIVDSGVQLTTSLLREGRFGVAIAQTAAPDAATRPIVPNK